MGNSQDSMNGYIDLKLPKSYNKGPNPQLKEFAYLKRFTENGMALEGKGGIILKNGKYAVHKFVHRLDPVYTTIPVTWIKKNENNNQPIGLIQVNDNEWDGSVPIMHATRSNVRFYGCCLDPDENDDIQELNARDGGMFDFNYTNYYDTWTRERNGQQGTGGCRIERHQFAHIETPLSREGKSGVFILGKLVKNDSVLLLTAFIIARGQTLWVPPNTIHTNDYQRGLWRTYLEIGDIDICDLVKRRGVEHKIERMRLNFYCGVTKKRMKQYDIEPLAIQSNKSEEHGHDMAIRRQHTLLKHLNTDANCESKDDDEDEAIDLYCECGTKLKYIHSKGIKPMKIPLPPNTPRFQTNSSVIINHQRQEEPKKKVQFNLINGLISGFGESCFGPEMQSRQLVMARRMSMGMITCYSCSRSIVNEMMYHCPNKNDIEDHEYNLCWKCAVNQMLRFTENKQFDYADLSSQIFE